MHFATFETLLETSVLVREMYVEGQKDQERRRLSQGLCNFSEGHRAVARLALRCRLARLARLAAPLLSLDSLESESLGSLESQSLLREVARVDSCLRILSSLHFDFPSYVREVSPVLFSGSFGERWLFLVFVFGLGFFVSLESSAEVFNMASDARKWQ